MENRLRSLIKSITWRIIASLTTALLVFLFTRSLVISTSVASLEFFLKIIIYYSHERTWNMSSFGRKSPAVVDSAAHTVSPENMFMTLADDDHDSE